MNSWCPCCAASWQATGPQRAVTKPHTGPIEQLPISPKFNRGESSWIWFPSLTPTLYLPVYLLVSVSAFCQSICLSACLCTVLPPALALSQLTSYTHNSDLISIRENTTIPKHALQSVLWESWSLYRSRVFSALLRLVCVPLSFPACRLPAVPSDTFNAVCHAAFFPDKNYNRTSRRETTAGLLRL